MKTIDFQTISQFRFCPPFASTDFYETLIRFVLNLIVLFIISRLMYYKWNKKPEYMFAQLISGIIVFIITSMLRWVQLDLGLVLGLFAIFAIIRFRTINIPVKEMTYLFMAIGISAVNGLMDQPDCLQWIIFANSVLLLAAFLMEKSFFGKRLSKRVISYDNTDLIKPSKREQLIKDLREKTELNIIRLDIGKVDYVKNHAQIRIYFTEEEDSFTDDSMNDE